MASSLLLTQCLQNDFVKPIRRAAARCRSRWTHRHSVSRQTLNPPEVDASILLHASTFGWALLFCFVLNLMSSGFPAWKASRIGIVNALGGRLH